MGLMVSALTASTGLVAYQWLPMDKARMRMVHGVVQVMGGLFMLAGFTVMYNFKHKNGADSFTSYDGALRQKRECCERV